MTVVHDDVDAFPSSSRSACTRVDGTLRNDDDDDDDSDRGGGVCRLDVDVDATMRRLVVGINESEAKSDDQQCALTSQLTRMSSVCRRVGSVGRATSGAEGRRAGRRAVTTSRCGRRVGSVVKATMVDDDAEDNVVVVDSSSLGRRTALARVAAIAATIGGTTTTPAYARGGVESLYDLTAMQYGKERSLGDFKNKVTVIVNVASE